MTGTSVQLSDASSANPTFTAPTARTTAGSLTFQLTVTDKAGLKATDNCIVNVTPAAGSPAEQTAPVANAGPDQSVDAGVEVSLDGSNSTDSDDGIASYLWKQKGGPAVTLSSTTVATPTFTAPEVVDGSASLSFELTVTDNSGLKSTDSCIVNINSASSAGSSAPVADAGPSQNARRGQVVTLNGTNSSDPDDGIASYEWKQMNGPAVTLAKSTTAKPIFRAPSVGNSGASLTFQLTVKDKSGLQSTDTCIVQVVDKMSRADRKAELANRMAERKAARLERQAKKRAEYEKRLAERSAAHANR
jgi:hypothetical protein